MPAKPGKSDDEEIPNAFVARRDERPTRDRSDQEHGAATNGAIAASERPRRSGASAANAPAEPHVEAARSPVCSSASGRKAGMRPADLVGAIANEAGLDSRDIGAIDITDRFSLVEVPEDAVEEVIRALRGTTIRGKKVLARRDRE